MILESKQDSNKFQIKHFADQEFSRGNKFKASWSQIRSTWREEGSSDRSGSRERTTLATGWVSEEEAWLWNDLPTTGGHFMSHTDLSALPVSKWPPLLPLLPWSSSIFDFSSFPLRSVSTFCDGIVVKTVFKRSEDGGIGNSGRDPERNGGNGFRIRTPAKEKAHEVRVTPV